MHGDRAVQQDRRQHWRRGDFAGAASSTATINSKAVKLRPQVAVWEREVPTGTGITGLWRPASNLAAAATNNPMALAGGNVDMIFTLRQNGKALTGTLESAAGGGFGGGGAGGPIQDGKVDGSNVSFRVGMTTYTGTVNEDRIELQRSGGFGGRGGRGGAGMPGAPAGEAGPRPVIGPPPDGTDPSFGAGFGGGGRGGGQAPLVLRRVTR